MSRKKSGSPISLFSFQDAITSVCGVVVLVTLILALDLTRRTVEATTAYPVSKEQVEETRRDIAQLKENLRAIRDMSQAPEGFEAETLGMSLDEVKEELEGAKTRLEMAKDQLDAVEKRHVKFADLRKRFKEQEKEIKELQKQIDEKKKETAELIGKGEDLDRSVRYSFSSDAKERPWFVDIAKSRVVAVPSTFDEEMKEFPSAHSFVKWAKTRNGREEYFVLIVRPSGADAYHEIKDDLDRDGYRYGIDLAAEDAELVFTVRDEEGGEE